MTTARGAQVVLGIDAAWTATHPSGVALVRGRGARWEVVAVAPSYRDFVAVAAGGRVDWSLAPPCGAVDCRALVDAATILAGQPPDVIAVDMPLSTRPIATRRRADNALSETFGRRGCAVHSPSRERPGRLADELRRGFVACGFRLACADAAPRATAALLEVYPHTALLRLLDAPYRVPYKTAKTRRYWPTLGLESRRRRLLAEWTAIVAGLSTRIRGIALTWPSRGPLANLKRHEDALDALICAWVGIEYLAGRATAYGDDTAAIWT